VVWERRPGEEAMDPTKGLGGVAWRWRPGQGAAADSDEEGASVCGGRTEIG
jgi:hypothetical protein